MVGRDRPHVAVNLETDGARCEPRCRDTLGCVTGQASRVDGRAGRAFQARDRRGHIGATIDRIAADNHGHPGPSSAQLTRRTPRPPQVAAALLVSDTEEVLRSAVQTTMLIAGTRPGRWLAALPAIGGS